MSVLSRSLTALALVSGLAVAAPAPVRADSFSFGFSIGDHNDGWRRDHRGDNRRHWDRGRRHHRHGHHGPPPWIRYHPPPRYYAPHCQPVWSHWHQAFVTVCR